jgi:hypothetical protein
VRYLREEYGVLDGAFAGLFGGTLLAAGSVVIFPLARLGTPWSFINHVSATIDQGWARYEGFHWLATPYGLFVHVLFCLSLGVLISWASNRSFLWATVTGALVASGFWWLAHETWLPLINPALYRAVPSSLLAAGHLALGLFVGIYLDARGRTVVKEVHSWAASPTAAKRASSSSRRRSAAARPSYSSSRA